MLPVDEPESSRREENNDDGFRFFSLLSHRLVICTLLLLANYFGFANTMTLSTAVVCMVNSTLTVDKFNQSQNIQTCSVRNDEASIEFAIPGTMDWTASEQSFLLSSRFYGSCLSVAFSGAVVDRFGADFILSMVLVLSSAITLLTPLVSFIDYYLLLASRFMLGFIESFHTPAINCLTAVWFPPEEKAVAASIFTSGYQFAGGFSSLFAAALCKSNLFGGWPSIFYLFGGASLLFVIFWMVFASGGPKKNRWLSDREKNFLETRIKITSRADKGRTPYRNIFLSPAVHAVTLCNFAYSFSTSITQIGWYTLTPFLAQIIGKIFVGIAVEYGATHGIITLTNATKIAQSMGSFGAAITLIFLPFLPTCDNPTIAFYILLLYGLLYSGGTCGFYTSTLCITSDHMGILSSITAVARIAASLIATFIVNGLTAMESPLKWPLVFASASLIQAVAGLHFIFFGTTELQKW